MGTLGWIGQFKVKSWQKIFSSVETTFILSHQINLSIFPNCITNLSLTIYAIYTQICALEMWKW